jgi:hypothetical protein
MGRTPSENLGHDEIVCILLPNYNSPNAVQSNSLRHKEILKTYPNINEEMKLGVPWYEGKYYIVALKDHVNLGFSIKGLSKKEVSLFKGTGKTMKNIEIRSVDEINEGKIVGLLKTVK